MSNTPTFIHAELKRRGVPVEIIDAENSLMRYFHNNNWHLLKNCLTEKASVVSAHICGTKNLAEMVARSVDMPVPESIKYESHDQAMDFIAKHRAVVVKPLDSAHGNGVSMNVRSKTDLKKALTSVRRFSKKPALLQETVHGDDIRILVINGKYTAAVRRVPPQIIGDGVRTIEELINAENKDPERLAAVGMRGTIGRINLHSAKNFLKRRLKMVPKKGEIVKVLGVGNTSLGGHAEDFTDDLPASIYQKAEAFAKELKLPVCGVDIMLDESGDYHFIEGNACPGFGPHHHARVGERRDVTKVFVDMLLESE